MPAAVGLHDVVGVGGVADAGGDAVDLRAARPRVLLGLEDDDPRPLAEHEAVAVLVVGPRGALRLVVARGHGAHRREGGQVELVDRRLRATRDRRRRRGRRGSCRCRSRWPRRWRRRRWPSACAPARAPNSMLDLAGGAVGHQHRHGERRDALPALLPQRVVAVEGGDDAPDPAGDDGPQPVGVDAEALDGPVLAVLAEREAGVAPGLVRGDERELLGIGRDGAARCLGRTSEGSTATVAAIFTGRSLAQSASSGLTPERPASRADQVDATSPPRGVVAPSPVTTTEVLMWSRSPLLASPVSGWYAGGFRPRRPCPARRR